MSLKTYPKLLKSTACIKSIPKKIVFVALLLFGFVLITQAQTATYSFTGSEPTSLAVTSNSSANITFGNFSRGSGITANAASGIFQSTGWTTGTVIDVDDYYEVTVTPDPGWELGFTSSGIVFDVTSATTGPNDIEVRSSLDNYATRIGSGFTGIRNGTTTGNTVDLSAGTYQNLTSAITFRFYAFNDGSAGLDDLSIDNVSFSTSENDFSPLLVSTTPTHNSTELEDNLSPLIITFNQPMQAGTGDITINEDGGTPNLVTITVPDGRVTYSGNDVQIDVSALDFDGITYEVNAVSGAFQDLQTNGSLAIVGNTDFQFTVDPKPEISSGKIFLDNVYVDLVLSEGVYTDNGGVNPVLASDFAPNFVQGAGTATDVTIFSVKKPDNTVEASASALTGGESTIRVFLSVTGTADGQETIEVKPTDGASIFDSPGNAMAGTETTTPLNLELVPTITSGTRTVGANTYIDVLFSEPTYNAIGGAGALEVADFNLAFLQNTGNATDVTISSVKQNDNAVEGSATALAGGELTVRVFLTVTGTPGGAETVEINAVATSIFDAADNPMANSETTGALNLYDELAPTLISVSVDAANTLGTLTFSEGVFRDPGSNSIRTNELLVYTVTGGKAGTSGIGSVTHVAGTSTLTFGLNLTNTPADGNETLTIGFDASGGDLFDLNGNENASPGTVQVSLNDLVIPTLTSGKIFLDNVYVDVVLSEGVYTDNGGSNPVIASDFDPNFVQGAGTATDVTIFSVKKPDNTVEASASALTGGESTIRVFLSVTGTADGQETIEVKPTDGASIFDSPGNAMAGTETTTPLNLELVPTITSGTRTVGANTYIDVLFSEPTYNAIGGAGALEVADFNLAFLQNTGNATDVTISSVKQNDNAVEGSATALAGGELTVRVFLTVTGTPGGAETVEINAVATSIFDAADNPMANSETTGALNLYDELAPTLISVSVDAANTLGTLTFSEGVFRDPGSNSIRTNELLVYTVTGGKAGTSGIGSVTHVAGTSTLTFGLNLTNTPADGNETLTIGFDASGGDLFDLNGNENASPGTVQVSLNDLVIPTITSGKIFLDNVYVDVVFSEGLYTDNGGVNPVIVGDPSDFAENFVQGAGTATGVAISSVKKPDNTVEASASALTGGESVLRFFLNVTGTANGQETIEIKPTDGASVFDAAGNAMAATETTTPLNLELVPTISSGTRDAGSNTFIDLTFSEPAYNATGGAGALETTDIVLTFLQNGGNATNTTISSVKQDDNAVEGSATALAGGETTIRVFLNVTGTASGAETIELKAATSAIFDDANNEMADTETTGALNLLDELIPILNSLNRLTPSTDKTNATTVTFRLTFSEDVQSVSFADFAISGTASGNGESVNAVTANSASEYDIEVIDIAAEGTINLDFSGVQNIKDLANNNFAGTITSEQEYIIDTTIPEVTSIVRQSPTAQFTNAGTVTYRVTFNEDVVNVDLADFTLSGTASSGGENINSVTANSAVEYDVEIIGVVGNGTLNLDFAGGQNITDIATNGFIGTITAEEEYTIDNTAPDITSILRQSPLAASTTATAVTFRVTFDEPVVNVDLTDFVLSGTASGSLNAVTANSTSEYDVDVITVSGNTTDNLNLDIAGGNDIADNGGNAFSGTITTEEEYNVDNVIPEVTSIVRQSPTAANININSATFRVTFDEPVNNVNQADFVLTLGGTAAGNILSVSPNSSSEYDVNVNGIGGDGTLNLDFTGGQDITDNIGNAFALTINAEEEYIVDNTPPEVTSIVRLTPAQQFTNANTVIYRVTFDEDVTGVDLTDFALSGTATGNGESLNSVTPISATEYDVDVINVAGDGILSLGFGSVGINDLATNNFGSVINSQEDYTIDNTQPSILQIVRLTPSGKDTNANSVTFRVTFDEPMLNVDATDFALSGAAFTGTTNEVIASATDQGDQENYDVLINSVDGDGVLNLDIAGGNNITDRGTNTLSGTIVLEEDYLIDNTFPAAFDLTPIPAPTGGTVSNGFWNDTNTGINVTVDIDNADPSINNGILQIQAKKAFTANAFEDVGSPVFIAPGDITNTFKTVSLTDTEFEAITGYADTDTIVFNAIITDIGGNATVGTQGTARNDSIAVDITPPAFISDEITFNANGSSPETLVFNTTEELQNSAGAVNGFSTSNDNIADTHIYSGKGSTNTITLTAFADNQWNTSTTVNYDVVTGDILDLAGNEMVAFTGHTTVINEVNLGAGDIAITSYRSDGNDYSFVLLKDIPNGTKIKFTDKGWMGTSELRFTDNGRIVTWEATSSMFAGTEVTIYANSPSHGSLTSPDGELGFSTSGDQLLAFQGTTGNPTFLAAIQMDGSAWDGNFTDADSDRKTTLPPGLTDATDAIVFSSELDNAAYLFGSKPTSGSVSTLLNAIMGTDANWDRSDTGTDPTYPTAGDNFTIPPDTTVLTPANGGITQLSPTISITFDDNIVGGTNVAGNDVALFLDDNTLVGGFNIGDGTITIDGTPTVTIDISAFTPLTDNQVYKIYVPDLVFQNTDGNSNRIIDSTQWKFLVDGVLPTLAPADNGGVDVSISSNNADNVWAKAGDDITLTFTSSETLGALPVVDFFTGPGPGGIVTNSVVVTDLGSNNYRAVYTTDAGDTDGPITFTIDFQDVAGNNGVQVTATTDATGVTFDDVAPGLDAMTINSSNALADSLVRGADAVNGAAQTVTVFIDADETLPFSGFSAISFNSGTGPAQLMNQTPSVTSVNTTDPDDQYDVDIVANDADKDGDIAFSITFTDRAGNSTTVTEANITDLSTVTVDNRVPILTALGIKSNNTTNIDHAKTGDVDSIIFTTDEPLAVSFSLSITTTFINSGGVAVTGNIDSAATVNPNEYTVFHNVLGSDTDGLVTFSITYSDSVGNSSIITEGLITDGSDMVIDNTPPQVSAISNDPADFTAHTSFNGSDATAVHYIVDFTEDVNGVDASDFNFNAGSDVSPGDEYPGVSGQTITGIAESGFTSQYTLTVGTFSGTGTLGVEYPNGNLTVIDSAGNATNATFTKANGGANYEEYNIVLLQPSQHPLTFTASNVSTTSIRLNWTNNQAPTNKTTHFLILANNPSGSITDPTDGTPVAEDLVFVGNDGAHNASSAFTVVPASDFYDWTGLVSGTQYDFKIVPYALSPNNSTDNINYFDPAGALTLSQTTLVGIVSTLSAGVSIEPDTLSSLATELSGAVAPQLNSVVNFDFILEDDGTTEGIDNVDTKITDIYITQGTGNEVGDWTQAIAGAELSDGSTTILASNINNDSIEFTSIPFTSGLLGHIADNAPKTYSVRIWLQTSLGGTLPADIDGKDFVFQINADDILYDDNTTQSSRVGPAETENSTDLRNTVSVSAKKLVFTNQPNANIGVGADFAISDIPQVTAQDHNNNTDLDFTQTVTVTNTGGISMDNDPTTDFVTTPTPGIIDFASNFSYKYFGDGQLTVASSTPVNVTSAVSTGVTVHVSDNTTITAGSDLETSTISSLDTTVADAFLVFDFQINDDAGVAVNENDTIATQFTGLTIDRNASDETTPHGSWIDLIADAAIVRQPGVAGSDTVSVTTINAASLVFTGFDTNPGGVGYVGDGLSQEYHLIIFLKTSMGGVLPNNVDNLSPIFELEEGTIAVLPFDGTSAGSSTFPSSANITSGAANNEVDVVVTKFEFDILPSAQPIPVASYETALISLLNPTPVQASARDRNNNFDKDYHSGNGNAATVTNADGLTVTSANITVTNGILILDAAYTFEVDGLSLNGADGTLTFTDNVSPGINGTTNAISVEYSGLSDIVQDGSFSYDANFDYKLYQANDISNANSIVLDRFTLRDAGGGTDDDGSTTIITDLTIDVENWENVRRIALYSANGMNEIDTLVGGLNDQVVTQRQITFSGLDINNSNDIIEANDNGNVNFTIRATFHGTDYQGDYLTVETGAGATAGSDLTRDPGSVTDNDTISFTIINVVAEPFGSQFVASDGNDGTGGAISTLTGDENRIEVTADRAIFTTDIDDPIAISTFLDVFAPDYLVVKAKDIYYSTDVDYTGAIGVPSTQSFDTGNPLTFRLNGTPLGGGSLPGNFTAGVYVFFTEIQTFQYTSDGQNGELIIPAAGLTSAISQTHSVAASEESSVAYITSSATIPYLNFPDAGGAMTVGNSFELVEMQVVDGEGFPIQDIDGAATILTDITIELTNTANLFSVGLFDGTTLISEQAPVKGLTDQLSWSGLSITAVDNSTQNFSFRATFEADSANVFDNEEIKVTVISVTNGGGSKFANPDGSHISGALPVAQTPSPGNLIDVVASQLLYRINSNATEGINIPLLVEPEVRAVDANEVRDLDHDFLANISTPEAAVSSPSLTFVDGILTFPGFKYLSTGDGILTVSSDALRVDSLAVDVIHTTFKNLDLNGGSNDTNNGIDPRTGLPTTGINLALLGFEISTVSTSPSNIPLLDELTIQFANTGSDSITDILDNIQLWSSPDPGFDFSEDNNLGVNSEVGFDSVKFTGLNIDLTDSQIDKYYFLVADVDPTVSSSNVITASLTANGTPDSGVPNGDIFVSHGSVSTESPLQGLPNTVEGRAYAFLDISPPQIASRIPPIASDNFGKGDTISITFDEFTIPAIPAAIQIFKKADNLLLANIPLDSVSSDSTTFFYPTVGVLVPGDTLLAGDTRYYIKIQSNLFEDKLGNKFQGESGVNDWPFKTSDNVPPVFSLAPEVVGITDLGFDVRLAMDEPGRVYFIVTNQIFTLNAPEATNIRDAVVGGDILIKDTLEIIKAGDYHYQVFFDTPLAAGTTYEVYMIAEDNVTPTPNLQLNTEFVTLSPTTLTNGQFTTNFPNDANIINTPNSELNPICIGESQVLLAPIQIIEGSVSGNNPAVAGNVLALELNGPFVFNTNAENDTVFTFGDIANVTIDYSGDNPTSSILLITYDITNTIARDKMIISGLEIISTGNEGETGSITKFFGQFPSILVGETLATINTTEINPINWDTGIGKTTIGNNIRSVALVPDALGLDGTNIFTGEPVAGDSIFTDIVALGLYDVTMTHTDEFGCQVETVKSINIFDSERAIAGLRQIYCTDEINFLDGVNDTEEFIEGYIGTTKFLIDEFGRAPNFFLRNLIVEESDDTTNLFSIDVTTSLVGDFDQQDSSYVFDPSVFGQDIDFFNFNNEGGRLGELRFIGVYQNQNNLTLFDTLEQFVEIFIPPSNSIDFNEPRLGTQGPFGGKAGIIGQPNPFADINTDIEYCEDDGDVSLSGSPKPSTGSSIGFFTIDDLVDSLFVGLSDNGDGSGVLNTQAISDATGFGNYEVKYIFQSDLSGCNDTIPKTIRINPKPRANFSTSLLCEDTPIDFTELAGYTVADSASILATTRGAIFPQIVQWNWNFNDPNATVAENVITRDQTNKDSVIHTYTDPGVYLVDLDILTEFGCVADTTIQLVVGGIPGQWDNTTAAPGNTLGFDFSGTGVNDSMRFRSTTDVFKLAINPLLRHSTDSLIWDFGDGNSDVSVENDSLAENRLITSHKYADPGFYDVDLTLFSTVGCSNSISQTIVVLARETPDLQISYIRTFEADSAEWIDLPEIGTTANTWAWGNPSKTTIVPGFDQGNKVWITGLSGSYDPEERSYVYSPSFDLSQLQRPMLSLDINRQLKLGDGVIIEYSQDSLNIMDFGKVWITLGGLDTGFKWYDEVGLSGSPGNDISQVGWTGEPPGWIPAKHTLSKVFGETRIVLRIGLGSASSDPNVDGFAFDNVRIGERTRTVLVESFTNTQISGVKAENDIINNFDANDLELIKLEYHTDFPSPDDPLNDDNPAVPSARSVFYGITEDNIPTARMDGLIPADRPDNDDRFSVWGSAFFTKQTLQLANFRIDLTVNVDITIGDISIDATLTAIDSIPANTIVHTAIVEQFVKVSDLGLTSLPSGESAGDSLTFVVKQMLPSPTGTKFENPIPQGESISISEVWQPANIYNADYLSVIVFAQNEDNAFVYQSARVDFATKIVTALELDLEKDGLALYPNPASDYAILFFKKRIDISTTIRIYDQFGRVADHIEVPYGTKQVKLETNKYSSGLFIIQIEQKGKPIIHKKLLINN